jgi:hypothetical protein
MERYDLTSRRVQAQTRFDASRFATLTVPSLLLAGSESPPDEAACSSCATRQSHRLTSSGQAPGQPDPPIG